jgi:hypothetical protein
MTNKELLEKYPDANLEEDNLINLSNADEKSQETRFKIFSPLFDDLYENKMIWSDSGATAIVELEDLKITPKCFSAIARPLHIIRSRLINPFKGWEIGVSWSVMSVKGCYGLGCSYFSTFYIEPNFVRKIEKIVIERNKEMFKMLCRHNYGC